MKMGSKKVKRKCKASKGCKSAKNKNFNTKKINLGFDINKCQSVNRFSKIRENYFNFLQNVIKENLESAKNQNLENNSLEKISLEVEQPALLACMQSEIYQENMMKIIHDIKNSTQQMKLHLGIKQILLSQNFEDIENSPRLNKESKSHNSNKTFEESTNGEVYSHIPTISSIRANYNEHDEGWCFPNLIEDEYSSLVDNFPCQSDTLAYENNQGPLSVSCEAQDIMQAVYSPSTGEQYVSLYNNNSSKYLPPVVPSTENQDLNVVTARENEYAYLSCNLVPVQTILHSGENYCVSPNKTNAVENELSDNVQTIPPSKLNSEESFAAVKSPSHIQETLESPSIKDSDFKREDEGERTKGKGNGKVLENISEGDMSDSLSGNYYDETYGSDAKHENLLADRLEEMRQMFGIRDYEEDKANGLRNEWETSEDEKHVRNEKIQKCNTWYHEKTVNLYKLSRMVSELAPEMRKEKRNRLFEYFGEDSDEENEIGYVQEEKFLLSCKERISHWVVKHLMPFYHSRRIVGRNVFKVLGHHVSNSVIQKTPYPDEWTVKYVVSRYFTADKSFLNESDVLSFQPDL